MSDLARMVNPMSQQAREGLYLDRFPKIVAPLTQTVVGLDLLFLPL